MSFVRHSSSEYFGSRNSLEMNFRSRFFPVKSWIGEISRKSSCRPSSQNHLKESSWVWMRSGSGSTSGSEAKSRRGRTADVTRSRVTDMGRPSSGDWRWRQANRRKGTGRWQGRNGRPEPTGGSSPGGPLTLPRDGPRVNRVARPTFQRYSHRPRSVLRPKPASELRNEIGASPAPLGGERAPPLGVDAAKKQPARERELAEDTEERDGREERHPERRPHVHRPAEAFEHERDTDEARDQPRAEHEEADSHEPEAEECEEDVVRLDVQPHEDLGERAALLGAERAERVAREERDQCADRDERGDRLQRGPDDEQQQTELCDRSIHDPQQLVQQEAPREMEEDRDQRDSDAEPEERLVRQDVRRGDGRIARDERLEDEHLT